MIALLGGGEAADHYRRAGGRHRRSAGRRLARVADPVSRSFAEHEDALGGFAVFAAVVLGVYFHEDHFVLLLVITVLLYTVATLGLNIQFGYAGVLNFAGASFFGIGAYTSAVLNTHTALPHLLVLLIGGLLAALIGSLLLLPVLRTRGHYAARHHHCVCAAAEDLSGGE